MDEAGSRIHLTHISVPQEIEEQERLIEEAQQHKNEAIRLQNFELAASFRDRENQYTEHWKRLKMNGKKVEGQSRNGGRTTD